MSCVEYLRWQLHHCNGHSGRKPENSPKPCSHTLGTREEVPIFPWLSPHHFLSFRTTYKVIPQPNNEKGKWNTCLQDKLLFHSHIFLSVIVHQATFFFIFQTFLRSHLPRGLFRYCPFKWRKPFETNGCQVCGWIKAHWASLSVTFR